MWRVVIPKSCIHCVFADTKYRKSALNRIRQWIFLYKHLHSGTHILISIEISRTSSLVIKQTNEQTETLFTFSLICQTDWIHPKRLMEKSYWPICRLVYLLTWHSLSLSQLSLFPSPILCSALFSLSLLPSKEPSYSGAYSDGQPSLTFIIPFDSASSVLGFQAVSPCAAWRNFQILFNPGQFSTVLVITKKSHLYHEWYCCIWLSTHNSAWELEYDSKTNEQEVKPY